MPRTLIKPEALSYFEISRLGSAYESQLLKPLFNPAVAAILSGMLALSTRLRHLQSAEGTIHSWCEQDLVRPSCRLPVVKTPRHHARKLVLGILTSLARSISSLLW